MRLRLLIASVIGFCSELFVQGSHNKLSVLISCIDFSWVSLVAGSLLQALQKTDREKANEPPL